MNKMAKCTLAMLLLLVLTMASAVAEVKVDDISYETMQAAVAANGSGKTYEIYGEVDGYFSGAANSTFIGMDEDAEIVVNPAAEQAYAERMGNITFKNLTFTTNNKDFKGFYHTEGETFTNCVIKGAYWTYATNATFNGCTFIQFGNDPYCLWSYGTENLTVEGCTFTSDHKFILLYKTESDAMTANLTDNVFAYRESVSSSIEKAAVEIDDGQHKVTLNAKNNQVDCRNPRGLWFDKDEADNTTVAVTGTTGYHSSDLTHKAGVDATYTATGTAEHWICEECETLFADQNGTVEVTEDELVIPMLKPTPAPEATPVPDTSDMPQTGDNSNIMLFAALLTMSAAGMLLLMRRRSAER